MAVRALNANFSIACAPRAKLKREGWAKPQRGYVKLSIDGIFDPDLLTGSFGVVIRDSVGKFVARGDGKIDWCGDSLMAEAMALRFGLSLALSAECNKMEVNSDNTEVIETMKNGGRSSSVAAVIFDDCYHLACDFPHVIFDHVPREANYVAHELAKLAKHSVCVEWMDEPPTEIVPHLVNDATMITVQ